MEELLLKLKELDVNIRVEDNNLKLSVPEGFKQEGIIEEIKKNKIDLINYFHMNEKMKVNATDIPKLESLEPVALTPPQARLFVLQGMAEDSNVYNIPFACELNGALNISKLEVAFEKLIKRHDSLRTHFVLNDNYEPRQIVNDNVEFKLEYQKCKQKEVNSAIQSFSTSFDLEKAPLLRAKILETVSEKFVLLIDVHHIIFDGVSLQIFLKELMALYCEEDLPAINLQFRDYASWYYSEDYQKNLSNQKDFWLNELEGYKNTAELPVDFKKSSKISFEGAYAHFTIDKKRKRAIEKLSKKGKASLFSVLSGLYSVLQAKLTGVDDLAIGTPVAGRRHWSLENMIGMFVNTLSMRFNPRKEVRFIDYLKEVNSKIVQYFENQEYPYEKVLEDLGISRDNEVNPLFNTLITLNNYNQTHLEINGIELKPFEIDKSTAKFDLIMHFEDKEDELGCTFEYSTELFKKETIERFFEYFVNVIDQVSENESLEIDAITLLDINASQQLLEVNNFSNVEFPREATIVEIFERQVAKTPENIAVVFGENSMTYNEINNKANQVARMLRNKGVGRNEVVGVMMEKSFEVIIGMLGILKAGGAYVPIDVNYPQNRIDYIVENSELGWVLSTESYMDLINNDDVSILLMSQAETIHDTCNLEVMNSPSDLSYVIYTSGTTGKPKGVMVEHKNVVRLLFNESFQFDFTDNDVWTMFHSHCFDFSVWEMYGPLLYGGKLVLVSTMDARDPSKFLNILKENKVTVLNQTPTSFYNLIKESIDKNELLQDLQYVIFGGEALIPSKLKEWSELHPETKLINMYGITEVTVHMTYKNIGSEEMELSLSNIGKALPTGSIYLLDDNLKPVPVGVVGEIYVGGEGVARGYINNEELTNSRFIESPFDSTDRLYKSGDLAILLENGELEYKRRADNQVQLKGFRIELKEIEHHLYQYDLISNVVVVKKESKDNEPYLCAYYTSEDNIDLNTLRLYLTEKLPHYMVPSYFMRIEELPYTSNSKIDISKLPEPKTEISLENYEAPTNEEEKAICEIWEKYLGVERIGISDNFFNLGGDSLRAIALIATINERLASSLVIADIYSYPTIKELANAIKSKQGEEYVLLRKEAEEELRLFQEKYKNENEFLDTYEEVYPMNGIEKGMVFYSLLGNSENIHNILYHEQNMYDLPFENFDFEIFKKAINLIVKKHSEFRKIYDLENFAHIILKEIEPDVHFIDLCHLNAEEQEQFISDKLEEEKLREKSLSMSLIWRMHIFKVREGFQHVLFDFNHSLLDGWSLASFLTELNNTCRALMKNENYFLKEIKSSYRDQILGELIATRNKSSINYWKNELSGYKRFELTPTGLPHEVVTNDFDLGKGYRKEIEDAANKLNTNFKHLCFAAIIYSLRRISYENDLTMGIVTNIRPLVPDGEDLLGCFLNTIPFRVQVPNGITWREYVNYIENKLVDLKYHERVPFYKILEIIDEKSIDTNPIFDVKLNYIDFRVYEEFEGYTDEIFGPAAGTKSYLNENTPLNLHILANNSDFILRVVHSASLLEKEQPDKLYAYFKNTLDQILEDADQEAFSENVLPDEDYITLTKELNATKTPFKEGNTILDLFKKQVEQAPDATSVSFKNDSLTYKELDQYSNQLAHKLIDMGVTTDTLVPICIDRSTEMIIGILGILKAGGAYVPIDPTYPQNRIDYILEDVQSPFVLTQSKYDELFEIPRVLLDNSTVYTKNSKTAPEVDITKSSLAYVIYTSGTTGKPKGVMNEHAGIYNRLSWMRDYFNVTKNDHILQKTNFCFDVSVWELMLPLVCGARLVFAKPDGHKDPNYIEQLLIKEGITLMHFVPSMLSIFLLSLNEYKVSKLRAVICSGEALKLPLVKEFQEKLKDVGLYNLYGPTEAAIDVTAIDLTNHDQDKVTIGKPIANTQIYIVNSNNEIQPCGVKGELLIGGVQVARGYLNKEKLTSEKFIDNPFDKNDPYKLYKTGDMARWLPDGTIDYLGRMDNQIKLRGNRIELGEIESSLAEHSSINTVIVDYQKYFNDYCIIAYYLADQSEPIEVNELKSFLKESLPEYMIPSYFVKLEEIPLTFNGKLNKSALPKPEIGSIEKYVPPTNKTEEKLVVIWSDILGIKAEDISIKTSFFNIGGHSLKAITLVNSILKTFNVEMTISEVFEKQTIKEISDYILTIKQLEISDQEIEERNLKLLI
ncbi:amino acid adenylation domain-containing protein [Aquimarina sp. D1M17]|uniref:non-ribosomal peptide synthetase n=1 Tax=Aquimarina acroporae TaxID=2937283 RepID=UPI0020BE0FBB|nr:non-ribosomal peptide synthetase [Aquimarina acroporae]MCK8524318.1 amino acid adenylation domain-containing protein [Aquimarina acroporae]